MYSELWYPTCW